jgi:Uncharacterised nucleotidyltransferase
VSWAFGLTRLDQVLLAAAVAPELPNRPVARAWAAAASELERPGALDRLSGERQDLIGLLHRTARAAGASNELAVRLAGGHRRTWVANQLRLGAIRPALEALARDGVRHLVTDDLAMAGWLADAGAQPLRRVRLLVPASDLDRAEATLLAAGWTLRPRPTGAYLADPRAEELEDTHGNCLELASRSADECDELWAGAETSELPGAPAMLRPGRGMLLAALIDDAGGWLPRPELVRLADVALLSAGAAAEEWQGAIARLARSHQLKAAVVRVTGLSALVPGSVPEEMQRSLTCLHASAADRLAHRLDLAAPSLARHLRQTAGSSPVEILRALPASLRLSWNLSSAWRVPPIAVGRVAERALRRGPGKGASARVAIDWASRSKSATP